MSRRVYQVIPARSIGPFVLGTSINEVLKLVQRSESEFPSVEVTYSSSQPLTEAVIVHLPDNGIRLRFDGQWQLLRLIEVLDFSKSSFLYSGYEIFQHQDEDHARAGEDPQPSGPDYRSVSKLFGPTYAGEYSPPHSFKGIRTGLYVLSYPGAAFSFPADSTVWSTRKDNTTLLTTSATAPATSMAVYRAQSWPEARANLYASGLETPFPKQKLSVREEVEDHVVMVELLGEGLLRMLRYSGKSFLLTLSETTPQDLVSELGPPDKIYRKHDRRLSIHRGTKSYSDHKSTTKTSNIAEFEPDATVHSEPEDAEKTERFFNYMRLGMDFLIGAPCAPSPPSLSKPAGLPGRPLTSTGARPKYHRTVTKAILHGNVPGSHDFGHYRRIRWRIEHVVPSETPAIGHWSAQLPSLPFTSEAKFDELMHDIVRHSFGCIELEGHDSKKGGMILNRGLVHAPSDGFEFLGGWEDDIGIENDLDESREGAVISKTSTLYGVPGMVFEVLENNDISILTVY